MFYMGFFILKNELFAHSLIFGEHCERIAQVAHQKLAMWANRSGWSPNMSVHERFSQVAHQKWVTMSESRRLLTNNEQMSELLVFLSKTIIRSFFRKNERFAQKTDEQIPSPTYLFFSDFFLPVSDYSVNFSSSFRFFPDFFFTSLRKYAILYSIHALHCGKVINWFLGWCVRTGTYNNFTKLTNTARSWTLHWLTLHWVMPAPKFDLAGFSLPIKRIYRYKNLNQYTYFISRWLV